MKYKQLMVAASLVLALAFALVACSSSESAPGEAEFPSDEVVQQEIEAAQEAERAQAEEPKPYPAHEARSNDDLAMIMEDAIALAESETERANTMKDEANTDGGELPDASEIADRFATANGVYRSGDYMQAMTLYENILTDDPLHYGANVNLVLARLNYGDETMALQQALKCVYLFSGDPGCYLNAQAAGSACEFGARDIDDTIEQVVYIAGEHDMNEVLDGFGDDYRVPFDYNTLWTRIETELYTPVLTSDYSAFDEIETSAYYLYNMHPDSVDAQQLLAYVNEVGVMIGARDRDASIPSGMEDSATEDGSGSDS